MCALQEDEDNMSEKQETPPDEDAESFEALFEAYTTGMNEDIQVGDRIRGEIISIGQDTVYMDTGNKIDGVVEKAELLDKDGEMPFKAGDSIELYVVALTESVDYSVEDGVAVLTVDNPPVNALSQAVRQGLKEGVARAAADDSARAVLLICNGRTFIAGADITEFSSGLKEPGLHEVLDAMDDCSKPVVAAIHGTALGGGLETALCCHYRVAVADARFGLPEVNLGLLPGAGGTQRLPRLVGVEKRWRW